MERLYRFLEKHFDLVRKSEYKREEQMWITTFRYEAVWQFVHHIFEYDRESEWFVIRFGNEVVTLDDMTNLVKRFSD